MRRTLRQLRAGSWLLVVIGCVVVLAGIAQFSLPVAVILAGLLLVGAGIEVSER